MKVNIYLLVVLSLFLSSSLYVFAKAGSADLDSNDAENNPATADFFDETNGAFANDVPTTENTQAMADLAAERGDSFTGLFSETFTNIDYGFKSGEKEAVDQFNRGAMLDHPREIENREREARKKENEEMMNILEKRMFDLTRSGKLNGVVKE